MSTTDRRYQIVQAALEAIGEYGLQGATISRIAKGAGITPAALYSHFANRRAILIAALERVYEDIADSFRVSPGDAAIEQFDRIFEHHAKKVLSQDKTSHAHLFLEFVASAPQEGLREVLREKELHTTAQLTSGVREQQRQGLLSPTVDAEAIAWLIAGWAWTGSVANLMDVTSTWNSEVSPLLQAFIRGRISNGEGACGGGAATDAAPCTPSPAACAQDLVVGVPADGLPSGTVFTCEEAAEVLKVSAGTVATMLREGRIRAVHLGAETRIPRRALIALLRGTGEDAAERLPGAS
jgi:excisionase family DNA binding protein